MLRRNIDARGRTLRLGAGLVLGGIAVAWALASGGWVRLAAVGTGALAALMIFEAAAGWCAARACGLRTPF
ncbi:MAG: hypothetical protein V3U98_07515 [Acidobacteriota bacterium]